MASNKMRCNKETTLPEEDLTGEEITLPEEDQDATGTENVENSEEADSNVVEQKTEETSVQEEKANDENVSETADNNLSGNCGATENDKECFCWLCNYRTSLGGERGKLCQTGISW